MSFLGYTLYISPAGWVALGTAAIALLLYVQWPQRAIAWVAEKLGY